MQGRGKGPAENPEGRSRKSHSTRQQNPQTYSFYNSENEGESTEDSKETMKKKQKT